MQFIGTVDGSEIVANFYDLVVLTTKQNEFSVWNVKPNGNWWGEKHFACLSTAVDCFASRCKVAAGTGRDEKYARV